MPDKPLELKGSKKTVMFPHAPHQKVECVTCHHKVQDKENFQKCATAGCHDDLTAKKGEKSLFYVVHTKTGLKHQTCLECHTKVVAEKPELKKDLTGLRQVQVPSVDRPLFNAACAVSRGRAFLFPHFFLRAPVPAGGQAVFSTNLRLCL